MYSPLPHRCPQPIVVNTFFNWKNSIEARRSKKGPFLDLSAHSEPIEFTWTIPKCSSHKKRLSIDSDSFTLNGSHFWKFHISFAFTYDWLTGDWVDSEHNAGGEQLILEADRWINKKSEDSQLYLPFGTGEKYHIEISVLDARGNQFGTEILHETFPFKRRFKLISVSELNDPANNLLSYDQLTIHFLVRRTKADCEVEECHHPAGNCHRPQLTSDFANLFTSKMNADVIFKVQNTDIAAHKSILTARSPVFAAMFQHQMKDNESGAVDVPDATPAVFNKLLQFIYTGECPLEDSTEELLMAADKYDIQGLKQFCEFELRAWALNVDTAIDLLVLSDLHNAQILRRSVVHFIKKNIAQMMKKPEWADFKKNYEHLARTFDF